MVRFIGQRLLTAVPTILLVTFLVFVLVEISPADPALALAGDNPTPDQLARIRTELGLDRPLLQRYVEWGVHAMHGDLGTSPVTHQSVLADLAFRLPITASLVLLALLMACLVGAGLGVLSALHRGRLVDSIVNVVTNMLLAVPPFMAAMLLVLGLALAQPIFPATGYASLSDGIGSWLQFSTLPALSLAIIPGALLARQVRGALIDALDEDYSRTARAKGLPRWRVVTKHAAKNAAVPAITVLGLVTTSMFGGAVVVERIFAIPGLGSLGVDSVLTGDLVTLQGMVLVIALVVTVLNLLVDASYGYFNPRLRKQ